MPTPARSSTRTEFTAIVRTVNNVIDPGVFGAADLLGLSERLKWAACSVAVAKSIIYLPIYRLASVIRLQDRTS
jgi:hypothetical protein